MRRYYYFIFRKIFTNRFCVRRVVMRWHMWARVVAFIMDLLALTWERVLLLLLLLLYILSFDFGILLISSCVAWSFRTNEWANHLIRSNLTIVDTHRHTRRTRINLLLLSMGMLQMDLAIWLTTPQHSKIEIEHFSPSSSSGWFRLKSCETMEFKWNQSFSF